MIAGSTEPTGIVERVSRVRQQTYDLTQSQESLLADIRAAVDRIIVSVRKCHLQGGPFFDELVSAMVAAAARGVAFRLISQVPQHEHTAIVKLVQAVRAEAPNADITLKHLASDVDLGFYGRIVDRRIVEVNEGHALCAQGTHVRTWGRGAAEKRNMRLRQAVDRAEQSSRDPQLH